MIGSLFIFVMYRAMSDAGKDELQISNEILAIGKEFENDERDLEISRYQRITLNRSLYRSNARHLQYPVAVTQPLISNMVKPDCLRTLKRLMC